MSHNNNNPNYDSLQRTINYPRRSISAGDTRHAMVKDDPSESHNDETNTNYNQYITPCDDDGYICTPLPRHNHRPTASTCWLVVMFSPP
jgi:hypothetical protein